ncbi:hypothetical protein LCGC14_1650300 [marine sediment metagenome]|uniref:Uncharacterized protein n=1 Tax=marine sediment metagenome TaxID=412755 RepID=A0A0F9HXU6_9ZZZZ
MVIIVEAFRSTGAGEKMIITKKVTMMSNLEETVRRLREACMIWEIGPSKKEKSPPQSSP